MRIILYSVDNTAYSCKHNRTKRTKKVSILCLIFTVLCLLKQVEPSIINPASQRVVVA